MQRWRLVTLAALVAAPVLTLVGVGLYHLWSTGLSFWLWWPLAGCFALAFFLGWRWQKRQQLLRVDFTPPAHWTDRDRAAWHLVEERAKHVGDLTTDQLTSLPLYLDTAQEMALELARLYHPRAKDPVGALTIPEILTVVELASHDLAAMVDQYLPGGHLLTINDLRRMKTLADWYPTASKLTWLIAGIFSPLQTAARFAASQAGVSRPWALLQQNVLAWFFTAYLHRLGSYLIDLNSGRLRVGADRFVELMDGKGMIAAAPATEEDPADAVRTVTFAVVGQAKVGKSSLINALLGEQKAMTDVVPATAAITRYELQPPGIPSKFLLLDTVGYSHAGPREDQKRSTEQAARDADVVLLVLHARNPGRQADLELVRDLEAYFGRHPDLRKPPVLAVLTHIDLLSPTLEWSPPYDWRQPQRPKETQMQQAVVAVQEQLGPFLAGVVPVCTAPGKELGVEEWLLPALVGLLDQAHAVALLRCLKAEANKGKVRKVFQQFLTIGKGLLNAYAQGGAIPSDHPGQSSLITPRL